MKKITTYKKAQWKQWKEKQNYDNKEKERTEF